MLEAKGQDKTYRWIYVLIQLSRLVCWLVGWPHLEYRMHAPPVCKPILAKDRVPSDKVAFSNRSDRDCSTGYPRESVWPVPDYPLRLRLLLSIPEEEEEEDHVSDGCFGRFQTDQPFFFGSPDTPSKSQYRTSCAGTILFSFPFLPAFPLD